MASENCDLKWVNCGYRRSGAAGKPPRDKTLLPVGLRLPVHRQDVCHARGCPNTRSRDAGTGSHHLRRGTRQKPSRFTPALGNIASKQAQLHTAVHCIPSTRTANTQHCHASRGKIHSKWHYCCQTSVSRNLGFNLMSKIRNKLSNVCWRVKDSPPSGPQHRQASEKKNKTSHFTKTQLSAETTAS